MFDDQNLVDKILEHSDAVLIMQSVQERLKTERQKRQEFYETITEDDKAEFINGEIVYHSPVVKKHNTATGKLYKLLDTYVGLHGLGFVGVEKIMITFTRNDYEPALCFFKKEKSQHFTDGQMHFPVPDLAIEVLSKSKKALKRDTETKFEDYQAHGVAEYWMVDPEKETIEQHVLESGKYSLVLKSAEGRIHSHAVEGFSIPIRAVFDEKENLHTLREMLG